MKQSKKSLSSFADKVSEADVLLHVSIKHTIHTGQQQHP